MKTKKNFSNEEQSQVRNTPGNKKAYYGAENGLDDFRRDENGLDDMERPGVVDEFEGHPI